MLDDMVEKFNWYLHEREKIRMAKEAGLSAPWTMDPILSSYKFTNINRANDRTTRWAIKNWYDPNREKSLEIQAINCAIFRYFGTIEFAEELGYQTDFNPERIIACANARMARKQKVFTGAYIITNGGISAPKQQVVAYNYLAPLAREIHEVVKIAQTSNSWEATARFVSTFPGMGAFMTKEILLDMMLTPVLENCTDKLTWTPAGPGAIRGLNRLSGREVGAPLSQGKALGEMQDLMLKLAQGKMFSDWMPRIGIDYGITDIQFSLCEIDKYLRVQNGEGRPRSRYNGKSK
jgi:hypothetical protein